MYRSLLGMVLAPLLAYFMVCETPESIQPDTAIVASQAGQSPTQERTLPQPGDTSAVEEAPTVPSSGDTLAIVPCSAVNDAVLGSDPDGVNTNTADEKESTSETRIGSESTSHEDTNNSAAPTKPLLAEPLDLVDINVAEKLESDALNSRDTVSSHSDTQSLGPASTSVSANVDDHAATTMRSEATASAQASDMGNEIVTVPDQRANAQGLAIPPASKAIILKGIAIASANGFYDVSVCYMSESGAMRRDMQGSLTDIQRQVNELPKPIRSTILQRLDNSCQAIGQSR
ncbi:MAG: hypothetical protein KDA59_09760 [Planctomycetales bacterium]|nr:hypothetical protein [Planctomycetales bacterium]